MLRYSKALLLLVATTVATLAASGVAETAIRSDPTAVPHRYLLVVAVIYCAWAPAAARSVTAPLRMIQRHTPGVGEHGDVYRDATLTQFESASVLATLLVLVAGGAAALAAGIGADATADAAVAAVLVAAAALLWVGALRDYRAGPRQTVAAFVLLLRGREAPAPQAHGEERSA